MEKKVVFSYYEKDLFPDNPVAVRFTLWSDGTIEKQDNLANMDDSKKFYGPEPDTAKIVSEFIYTNKEIINSIPNHISNDDIETGKELELQFDNKMISGNNILSLPVAGHPNYTHIQNLINLMDKLKHTVKVIH